MNKKTQLKIRNKWRESNIRISKELRNMIHGYIMSDGYISKTGRLTVDQSIKQEKFVEWLYNKLGLLRPDTPIQEVTRCDKRTNTTTHSRRFTTKALLQGYRAMWYKSLTDNEGNITYRKTLPKSLPCFFNSVFITLWYAGDGTKMLNQRGVKIEATAFTAEERLQLQKLFKSKFDISVQINRAGQSSAGNQQWTISINTSEYIKFHNCVTQLHLIPTLFPNKLHKI